MGLLVTPYLAHADFLQAVFTVFAVFTVLCYATVQGSQATQDTYGVTKVGSYSDQVTFELFLPLRFSPMFFLPFWLPDVDPSNGGATHPSAWRHVGLRLTLAAVCMFPNTVILEQL